MTISIYLGFPGGSKKEEGMFLVSEPICFQPVLLVSGAVTNKPATCQTSLLVMGILQNGVMQYVQVCKFAIYAG